MTTKSSLLFLKWIVVIGCLPLFVGAFVMFHNDYDRRCHHSLGLQQQQQQVVFSTRRIRRIGLEQKRRCPITKDRTLYSARTMTTSNVIFSSMSTSLAATDGGGEGGGDMGGGGGGGDTVVDASPSLSTIDTLPTMNSSDVIIGGAENTDPTTFQDVPYDSSSSHDGSVTTNDLLSNEQTTSNLDAPFFVTPITTTRERQKRKWTPKGTTKTTTETISRRKMLELVGLVGTTVVTGSILSHPVTKEPPTSPKHVVTLIPQPVLKDVKIINNSNNTSTSSTATTVRGSSGSNASPKAPSETSPRSTTTTTTTGKLEPINLTQVAAETNINVTMACEDGCVQVDSTNFTKVKQVKIPKWYPRFLPTPAPKVIKQINDRELLAASLVAGGITEMVRTSILYPIQTIKVRVQTDIHNYTEQPPPIEERISELGNNIQRFSKEGKLYAGFKPAILVLAPATGVYYGVRDVSKRMLSMIPMMGDIPIALLAALIADIISLCFRTPADALIVRLQAAGQSISSDTGDEEEEEELEEEAVGDWFGDSIKILPMVIVTDLPYLLSKLFLNKSFIHGTIPINQYAEYAILSAMVAAFFTTPFDVVRTRILVDSDGNFANGVDGGSGDGVLKTMKSVMSEGEGGIANLFAGWFERVLYLGIGRAWLEPLILIGYVGLRDTLLLEWF